MCEAKSGAYVMYCGHAGWFAADIAKIGNVNVVIASGPVSPDNLIRGRDNEATHAVVDFPTAYWSPRKGIFVVPENQCTELSV